jgi:hypothetical protein
LESELLNQPSAGICYGVVDHHTKVGRFFCAATLTTASDPSPFTSIDRRNSDEFEGQQSSGEADIPSIRRFPAAQHGIDRRRNNVGQRRSDDDTDAAFMKHPREVHLPAQRSRSRYSHRNFTARRSGQSGSAGVPSALDLAAGRFDKIPRHAVILGEAARIPVIAS